jgi:hypothetical protein
MPTTRHDNVVVARARRYLDRLLDDLARKLAPRVADEIAPRFNREIESWVATLEVMSDPALMADLQRANKEPDEDAQPYEEVRRGRGPS